jgi:hypothetical protein
MIDILGVYAVLYSLLLIGAGANFRRLNEGIVSVALIILTWGAAIYTGIHRNDVRWMGVKLFDSTYVFVAAFSTGCVLAPACFSADKEPDTVPECRNRVCHFHAGFVCGGIG